MKIKSSIIVFLLSAVCCLNMQAQSGSTEAKPVWYYIQVKGTGAIANLVLTDADGKVSGMPIDRSDINAISKQLWRFDNQNTGLRYKVINKYSKKQLTVALDAASGLRRPALVEDSPILWAFDSQSSSDYKLMRIANEPQDGKSGEIYLSQQGLAQQYGYKLVKTTSDSALFRFALNEIPIVSTDKATVWMNIRNPKTGKYLTDAVLSAPGMNFTLEASGNGLQEQQWKITDKGNGKVEFVNRATGNIIATETNQDKYYYVNYTANPVESAGWQYTPTSSQANQYIVYTSNAAGVTSYWNATTAGESPLVYSAETAANSAYAWIFSWVEEVYTGIMPVAPDNVRVYSANKRIYVEGCNDYRITSISGMPVRKDIELPFGIYLVTAKGKTTKILVK